MSAPSSPPRRLTGVSALALSVLSPVVAAVFTGATWPLFAVAPYTPLFLAVYASARWGTAASGLVATAIGVVWALWLAPAGTTQFSPMPTSIFAVIGVLATRLVSGRSEALEALQASEARAIRALEETTAAEAKLRQAQKMEAVGQLVSGVAHNFNNLLTITMGYADLLLDDATPQARPHLEEIRHATQRGAKLTRQLLALGRKRDLGLALVDVNIALRDMEALLLPVIPEDITLSMRPANTQAVVLMDPQDFDQILLNLVLNARDALPRGGTIAIEVDTVTVTAAEVPSTFSADAGAFVRVTVRDNGTGMTPEVLTHLFEPFFTTKEVDKGTGLGLAFTYGVVRNAQGFVTVTSATDRGTTVAIHFPVAQGTPTSAAAPVVSRTAEPSHTGSILVVEDELPVRAVAVRVLTSAGFTVLDAATPAEAIAIFDRRPDIALLLTDVVMPEMRGPDLARHLLTKRPELKVLLMSGYHQPTPGEPSEFVGIDKPFTSAQLIDAVRTALA